MVCNRVVELDFIESTDIKGINAIRRHISYIKVARRALAMRNNYEAIIFWQQFIGIYYSLLSIFSFSKKFPPAVILTFIFIRRHGTKGKLHKMLYKLAVQSKFIRNLVCHSSSEKRFYIAEFGEHSKEKFKFIPIGEGTFIFEKEQIENQDFYISGGASNRDYATLIEAFRRIDDRLLIACRPQDVEGIDIPENVEVCFDTYGDDFLDYLRQSKALILSIKDPDVSAGQLVLINAMRAKKMAIVTAGNCLDDYADKEFTIKVNAHSQKEIIDSIRDINNNPQQKELMEQAALSKYKECYSLEQYGENVGQLVKSFLKT